MAISGWILLRMRNVTGKICRENQKTHFMSSNFFRKSYRLWDNMKNTVESGRPSVTTWRMRIACWIPKAAYIKSGIYNSYCFSTAAVITRTRPIVTCIRTLPDWLNVFLTVQRELTIYCLPTWCTAWVRTHSSCVSTGHQELS